MQAIHFDRLLTADGWRTDISVEITAGRIAALVPGRLPGAPSHRIGLPGLPNLHSHAFQRGMAGLAETRGAGPDSFWSWREVMYRFALAMTPEDVEAVAAEVYVEMLEAGFTRVGEFHYLHHAPDGSPYDDPAEMAARIAAAAATSGIGLTLLPVFYARSGFSGDRAGPEQRRFACDLDLYERLLAASRHVVAGLDGAHVGVAPHSLRAASPEELLAVTALADGQPIHIHVAEQMREVEDCVAQRGARPVAWLLDHAPVDRRWCLIHATHMTDAESGAMARSGAVAGLCPVTEANLGDGIFDAPRFLASGGRIGIGTDSNVSVDAAGEMRQLEYSQRLARRARNVLAAAGQSTGAALVDHVVEGGHAALGQPQAGLAVGGPADIVSLDADHPALAGHRDETILDAWVFGAGAALVDCVWTRGRLQVEGGRHHARNLVRRRFAAAMARLAG